MVGPAFSGLAPAEQDAGLASAMVIAELYRRGKQTPLIAALAFTIAAGVATFFLTGPWWLVIPVVVVLFPISFVLAQALWLRGIAYGHDRRLAEVFGRDTPELLLDLNARNRHEIRGVLRAYLAVANPSRSSRSKRISSV